MKISSSDWEIISFLNRAKRRKEALKKLTKPKTPTQLKKEMSNHFTTSCRAISELKNKGLVECLNPLSKHYKYYCITKKGKKFRNLVK